MQDEQDIKNGMIKIPSQYNKLNSKHVKVIALIDDLEMIKPLEEKRLFTDEYINDHWRELIMTSSTDSLQDDDKILQEEYGEYLSAKHAA